MPAKCNCRSCGCKCCRKKGGYRYVNSKKRTKSRVAKGVVRRTNRKKRRKRKKTRKRRKRRKR